MRIRNKRDFWAGMMFAGIGVLFIGLSQQYEIGAAARMGPGYFPTLLGIILALLGVLIAAQSAGSGNAETSVESFGWREIFLVLGAVALFSIALPWLGMVAAIIVLILVASLASHEFSWKETIISIVVLLIMSYFVFVKGLELQFPLWPKFLTD